MSQSFKPGDIYFSSFPKFVQIQDTNDYNMDSMKPNPKPRPIAVLYEIDANRIMAAPISSDPIQHAHLNQTYFPIRAANYPTFLKNDSFVKLNQIQPIEKKWLYPQANPRLVGHLNAIDLERVQFFSLYATQTDKAYAKWVSEIVTKNITRLDPSVIEASVLPSMTPPRRRNPYQEVRGDIIECKFQPMIRDHPPHRVEGTHLAAVLTDGRYAHVPGGQAIVVPLLENTKENAKYTSHLDSAVSLNGKTYRACVAQLQPMNRDWMGSKAGQLDTLQQLDLDRAVISVLGQRDKVIDQSREIIKKHLNPSRNR